MSSLLIVDFFFIFLGYFLIDFRTIVTENKKEEKKKGSIEKREINECFLCGIFFATKQREVEKKQTKKILLCREGWTLFGGEGYWEWKIV